jgi:hypothetical protein
MFTASSPCSKDPFAGVDVDVVEFFVFILGITLNIHEMGFKHFKDQQDPSKCIIGYEELRN